MKSSNRSWILVAAGVLVPMVAARAARKVVGKGYEGITGEDAPYNPADPSVRWKDALVFTAATGVVGGVAKLLVNRMLAETAVPAKGLDLEDEMEG